MNNKCFKVPQLPRGFNFDLFGLEETPSQSLIDFSAAEIVLLFPDTMRLIFLMIFIGVFLHVRLLIKAFTHSRCQPAGNANMFW